jgi:hypothetical protein
MLGSECDIISMAVQKAFKFRCKAFLVVQSYCGPYSPANATDLVDGQPVVDL